MASMTRTSRSAGISLGNCCLNLQVVGDCFGHGIDDTHIKIRGAPVLDEPALESHQKMIADKLTVSELMTMAICALPPVVKVKSVSPLLPCVSLLWSWV